jgi:hypothetical protein
VSTVPFVDIDVIDLTAGEFESGGGHRAGCARRMRPKRTPANFELSFDNFHTAQMSTIWRQGDFIGVAFEY